MKLYTTLENELYKYSYGNYNPWSVPFTPAQTISLCCARNDLAAFQVLLYGEEEFTVSLDSTPALYKAWPVTVYRIQVSLEERSDVSLSLSLVGSVRDDDGNYKSEVLLSERKQYVEKLRVQPVYAELKTGIHTPAGIITGKVNIYESLMFGDEQLLTSLPFSLQVVPAVLPNMWESSFHLNLWQHHTSIARTYQVPLFSDEHFALLDRYLPALAGLGQKSITLILSDAPWSGQWSCYYRTNPSDCFEYNMVSVRRDKDGGWHYDFSVVNRYIRLCMSHHIGQEIELYGLIGIWTMEDAGLTSVIKDSGDAVRIRYFDEAADCCRYISRSEDLDRYLMAVDQNLCDNGWQNIAKVCCDEPSSPEAFSAILDNVKRLLPHITCKVTICSMEVMEGDYPQITDYVLNLPLILNNPERLGMMRERSECTFSFYTAIEPLHPNTFLCCHLAEARFLPWLSHLLGMDGYLRWAAWLWPDNAFCFDSYHYQKFGAGGTHFLYPGAGGTPLLSLRYKQLQKGLRDSLILQTYINQTGSRKEALETLSGILKKPLSELAHCKNPEEVIPLNQEAYDSIISSFLTQIRN